MKKNRDIQLLNTRDEIYSLAVNNILLHSMYHPLKEASNFAKYREDEIKSKKNIVIYGVGLGYHVLELLKLIDEKSTVDLYDIDEEIVEIAMEHGVLKEILKDNRIRFFHGYNQEILVDLSLIIKKSDIFIVFKPAVRVLAKDYIKFKEAMDRFEIGVIGLKKFGKMAQDNFILNSKIHYNTIEKFFENFSVNGRPIVLVASGPSLSLNIEKLKEIRGKVNIFAVGSALRALMNAGIKPDMIAIMDPQEIVYNQIKGYETLDVPLCFLSTASNLAVIKYKGPEFIFYNEDNKNSMVIQTGRSVATAVLEIAIKAGANTIIFVGQDLAYLNNKAHCDDYAHAHFDDTLNKNTNKLVEGINGSMLSTTTGLLYFKKWIEDKILANPKVKFINSSAGARIKGTIEMGLEEVFK